MHIITNIFFKKVKNKIINKIPCVPSNLYLVSFQPVHHPCLVRLIQTRGGMGKTQFHWKLIDQKPEMDIEKLKKKSTVNVDLTLAGIR